jgi:hypothetical protein
MDDRDAADARAELKATITVLDAVAADLQALLVEVRSMRDHAAPNPMMRDLGALGDD